MSKNVLGTLLLIGSLMLVPDPGVAQMSAARPWLWGRIAPGRFGVGFRVDAAVDSTRREGASASALRPLEMAIWFPTARGLTRDPVRFGTYVDLSDGSLIAGVRQPWSAEQRRQWLAGAISRTPTSLEPALLDRLSSSPMAAVRDAAPSPASSRFSKRTSSICSGRLHG
jgi:hypothetical protein